MYWIESFLELEAAVFECEEVVEEELEDRLRPGLRPRLVLSIPASSRARGLLEFRSVRHKLRGVLGEPQHCCWTFTVEGVSGVDIGIVKHEF